MKQNEPIMLGKIVQIMAQGDFNEVKTFCK